MAGTISIARSGLGALPVTTILPTGVTAQIVAYGTHEGIEVQNAAAVLPARAPRSTQTTDAADTVSPGQELMN